MDKIISIGQDELSSWDLETVGTLAFDLMVYAYENEGYDGSGFAAFKKGDKWFYQELGHCSCNGPLENVSSSAKMLVDIEQVINLAEGNYSAGGKLVAEYLKRNILGIKKSDTERLIALLDDEDFRYNFTGENLVKYIDEQFTINRKSS